MPKIHINRKIKIGFSVIVVLLYALYVYVPFSVEIPDDLNAGYVNCYGEQIELTQTEITAICEALETASVRRLAFYDDRQVSYINSAEDLMEIEINRRQSTPYHLRVTLLHHPLGTAYLECGARGSGKLYRIRNVRQLRAQLLEVIGRAETNKT